MTNHQERLLVIGIIMLVAVILMTVILIVTAPPLDQVDNGNATQSCLFAKNLIASNKTLIHETNLFNNAQKVMEKYNCK